MRSKLLATLLIAATTAAVAFHPATGNHPTQGGRSGTGGIVPPGVQQPVIEVVFVLDTTGSMGNLIAAAKEKIWSIASTMASAQPAPEIRMGLVAYRDRGDAYVTRVVDLSSDLDRMFVTLMDFEAAGGGDGPEAVNQALADALRQISWSDDPETYRSIFLVGDAPPHMDYPDEVQYPEVLAEARQRGIVVNTVQCGEAGVTRVHWGRIAQLAGGQYFNVSQDGGAIAIATPFDEQIAALSESLDATRVYYGTAKEQAAAREKEAAAAVLHEKAESGSRARRAVFNASDSGRKNFLGDKELIDAVASGRVGLEEIDEDALPASLQAMAPEERADAIAEQAKKRDELERQIETLAAQREAYIGEQLAETGGAEDSLDYKIYSAVRAQAALKGLELEAEPDY